MKVRWKTIAAWLGSIVGLTSCDTIGIGMCMYGTPNADFDMNITVCDENDNPIQGIKATAEGEQELYSDGKGVIKGSVHSSAWLGLYLQDVDGEANGGEFEPRRVNLEELNSKRIKKGDGSWYEGKYEVTGKVTMNKKQ